MAIVRFSVFLGLISNLKWVGLITSFCLSMLRGGLNVRPPHDANEVRCRSAGEHEILNEILNYLFAHCGSIYQRGKKKLEISFIPYKPFLEELFFSQMCDCLYVMDCQLRV